MPTLSHDEMITDIAAKYKTMKIEVETNPNGPAAKRAQREYKSAAARLHKALDEVRGRALFDYLEAHSTFVDAVVEGEKSDSELDTLLVKEKLVKSLFLGAVA